MLIPACIILNDSSEIRLYSPPESFSNPQRCDRHADLFLSHPVDSKEVAFRTAGRYAFKDAVSKARPVLLEPIVSMEVIVPEDKMGTITGDLSGRRGKVLGTDVLPGGMVMVQAQAPLAEVMQYQSMLKSATAGQGSFMMEFSHYEPTPPHIQQQVAAAYRPRAEEE